MTGVVAVGLVSYWNDRVVRNTPLTGTFMPIAATLLAVSLVMLLNGPLRRFRPRWALSHGDLAVAVGMMLVGSSLPNVGLMRYLPGHIVGFYHNAAIDARANELMNTLSLPAWPFVDVPGETAAAKGNAPEVVYYDRRAPGADGSLADQLSAVPWRAWLVPIADWGVFVGCLCGAVVAALVIFRPQWSGNERLPFPIAGIYAMLIEPPEPGRVLNRLLSARGFWVAAGFVLAIRVINGMHLYDPGIWPEIPVSFDLRPVLADDPWRFSSEMFRASGISFTMVGIAFFLQTRVSMSLWLFFVLLQVAEMAYGSHGSEFGYGRKHDLLLGSFVPYGIAMLWVARRHLGMVLRQMLGRGRIDDAPGAYLPHWVAGWTFVACGIGLVVWLMAAGASLAGAVVTVAVLLSTFVLLARIVAETGLHYVTFDFSPARLWVLAAQDLPYGFSPRTTGASYFWANAIDSIFMQDKSQAHAPHVAHALRLGDEAREDGQGATELRRRVTPGVLLRRTFPFLAALLVALAASYAASFVGALWAEYTYAVSLDRDAVSPLNDWGSTDMPKWYTIDRTVQYLSPAGGPVETHSRPTYLAIGGTLATLLSVLRLRFAGWPLHPVGLLLCTTYAGGVVWFSMFVAWLAKTAVLRLGGSSLYSRAQPVFVGLVIGDALAGVFWVAVSLIRLTRGLEFSAVRI